MLILFFGSSLFISYTHFLNEMRQNGDKERLHLSIEQIRKLSKLEEARIGFQLIPSEDGVILRPLFDERFYSFPHLQEEHFRVKGSFQEVFFDSGFVVESKSP